MNDSKQQSWLKRHTGVVVVVMLAIIIGLGAGVTYLLTTKNSSNETDNQQASAQSTNSSSSSQSAADTSRYKLTACKSGTSQTLGNAGYVVGADVAPGSYTVKDALPSSDTNASWTNVDVYAKQSDYKGHNDGNAQDSIQPNAGETAHTMLKDGEYVSVWADDAVFTCQ